MERKIGIFILGFFLSFFYLFPLNAKDPYLNLRKKMVEEQIKERGIKSKPVLEALLEVPRHLFVPRGYISYAYGDRPLPIGYGQTISQPYIVALMTELLRIKEGDKVLEIGTGSGYQAAILAELTSKVFTIEIIEPLAREAQSRLKRLGYEKVKVKIGDGYYGWPEEAPFDGIIVTCASPYIPPPLLEQLKEGGRMCIPLGPPMGIQELVLVEKKGGKIFSRSILPVRFVPMRGEH